MRSATTSTTQSKIVSIVLTFLLAFTMMPINGFAEELQNQDNTPVVQNDDAQGNGDDGTGAGEQNGLPADDGTSGENGDATNSDDAGNSAADDSQVPTEPQADQSNEAILADEDLQADEAEKTADGAEAATTNEDGILENGATIHQVDELYIVSLFGEAAENRQEAIRAVAAAAAEDDAVDMSAGEARELVVDLFAAIETSNEALKEQEAQAQLEEEALQEQPQRRLLSTRNNAPALRSSEPTQATSHPHPEFPRELDGSEIDSITLKWLPSSTQTTQPYEYTIGEDDEATTYNVQDALLYMEPQSDADMRVKFQLDYALSGEKNYAPGDVTITIPAYIFHQRTNNVASDPSNPANFGAFLSPMLQSPSRKTDFNWQLINQDDGKGGTELVYVFTNTRTMVAATRGFIQFQISGLTPHSIIDMSITDYLQATIEVNTHRENTIGLTSNVLAAQVNTFQRVTSATKAANNDSPKIITASELSQYASSIPEDIQEAYPNETHYVVVNWYMYPYHTGNQPYTLTGFDTRTDVWDHSATYEASQLDDPSADDPKPLNFHDGWVVSGTASEDMGSIDGMGLDARDLGTIQQGWYSPGTGAYSSVRVIYPLSQFKENTDYYFTNHVDYELTPLDGIDETTYAGANGRVKFSYTDPVWVDPIGHFNVFKWGNDNDYTAEQNDYGKPASQGAGKSAYAPELTTHSSNSARDDIPTPNSQHLQGYFGQYYKALNQLREGNDVIIGYTMKSEGYLLPWQYDPAMDSRTEEAYHLPVTMVTEDTGLWVGAQNKTGNSFDLTVHEDYDFLAIDFVKPSIGKIKAINVNPDGSFVALYAEDGTFEYQPDYDDSKIPPIILELQRGGSDEWVEYARADWTSG